MSDTKQNPKKTDVSPNNLTDSKTFDERISNLVPAYLQNRHNELSELKNLIIKLEYKQIERIGHRLKGNALSYGFPKLSEYGAQLETAAKALDQELIHTIIEKIESFLSTQSTKMTS